MRTASISELKARLSAYLDIVRQGQEVLVTDRGRLVARLSPIAGDDLVASRRDSLIRSGQLKAPAAPLTSKFLKRPRPVDLSGASLNTILDDREHGR